MEDGLGKALGDDVLKILYAAEEEKVQVGAGGDLTIIGPDGNAVTSSAPEVEPTGEQEPAEALSPDEEMN